MVELFNQYREWIYFGLLFISILFNFFKKGKIKIDGKFLEEFNMKYKTFLGTLTKESKEPVSQSFTPYQDQYVLDPATNELVKLEVQRNVQKYIESFADCALECVMDKFLNVQSVDNDNIIETYNQRRVDLADLGAFMELAEEYREKYEMPLTASVSEIYARIDKESQDLKLQLGEKMKQNLKLEITNNILENMEVDDETQKNSPNNSQSNKE